jgi:cytochrome c553
MVVNRRVGSKLWKGAVELLPHTMYTVSRPRQHGLSIQRDQLKNYRSGKRHHEVMSVIAKSLTDAEIANLSAWYSAIKVTVEAP